MLYTLKCHRTDDLFFRKQERQRATSASGFQLSIMKGYKQDTIQNKNERKPLLSYQSLSNDSQEYAFDSVRIIYYAVV